MLKLFKLNFEYFLILVFLWFILLENAFSFGILFDFGNGLELKISVLIRIFLIFKFVDFFIVGKLSNPDLKYVLNLVILMILFFSYGYFKFPKYFLSSLSVLLQTISILAVIPFLYYGDSNNTKKISFYNGLRLFTLINSILLIISYFNSNLIDAFESSSGYADISRSFGIMGDEIAIFLTYFILDSFHNKKWIYFSFFLVAIFLTGSIAATFLLIFLFLYYLYNMGFFNYKYFVATVFVFTTGFTLFFIFFLADLSVYQRLLLNLTDFDSFSGGLRILSFNTGWNIFLENPIAGLGFGFYGQYIFDLFDLTVNKQSLILASTYNQFLQILCEFGIIGLIFFVSNFLKLFSRVKASLKLDYYNSTVSYVWIILFFLLMQSGVWFLPGSFNFLLLVILIGSNLNK